MAWLDFAPSDAGLQEFGVRHGIHTLHLEDCRSDEQQAKIEHGDGYLFIVLKLVLLTSDELSAAYLETSVTNPSAWQRAGLHHVFRVARIARAMIWRSRLGM